MAGLIYPDILGSINQGYDRGQQKQVNRLLGSAIANPDDSAGAIGQAAAIDPKSALAVQGSIQNDQDRQSKKLAGAANYLLQAYQSGNKQQVEGAYQSVRPFLDDLGKKLGQGPASPNFTEEMLPHLYQIVGQAGGDATLNGQLPTGFREADLQAKAAGYQPGTDEYKNAMRVALGTVGRASNAGIGFQKITGADGRERVARQNPRTGAVEVYDETTGDFTPLGASSATPGKAPPTTIPGDPMSPFIDQANAAVKAGVPDDLIQSWLQQKRASLPQPSTAPVASPALGVSRAPEDTAGAVQNAKNSSDLSYLPQQEAIKTSAAIAQAGGSAAATTAAKNSAEQAQAFQQRQADARKTLSDLDEVDKLLPQATGGSFGKAIDTAAASVNHSTDTAKASAALDILAGRLTSAVPRMQGPQSDRDVELYQKQAGDLANRNLPIATRQYAAKELRRLQMKYLDNPYGNGSPSPIGQAQPSAAAPGGAPAGKDFSHLW
jgi:hypothetical protein